MPISEIYLKLAVGFARDPKVRALARYGVDGILARDLFVQMCLHCKENLTDGFVPAEEVGALAYPLPIDHANQLANQLASVGLTKEQSKDEAQGWQVLAYVKRNGTREDVERLSEVRAASGRKGGRPPGQGRAKANRNQVGKQNKSRPNPYTETESYTETEQEQEQDLVPAAPPRVDVERLCAHLADRIESNGSKRPSVTKEWRVAARLLIDRDGRTEDQIHAAIDWCQNDEFWLRNVMSMPTLRKQYDRLRLQAEEQRRARNGTPPGASKSTGAERAQEPLAAGQRVQQLMDEGKFTL